MRRLVAGFLLAAAMLVAAVTGVLWRRSEAALERAAAAAERAEAGKLVALGHAELDRYPAAALAYARKSLEVADTAEGRRLAVDALWRAPSLRILALGSEIVWSADFSPDGRWLAAFPFSDHLLLFADDGSPARVIPGQPRTSQVPTALFTPDGKALLAHTTEEPRVRMYGVPDGREMRQFEFRLPGRVFDWKQEDGTRSPLRWRLLPQGLLLSWTPGWAPADGPPRARFPFGIWPYDGGPPTSVGSYPEGMCGLDRTGSRALVLRGERLFVRPLVGGVAAAEREIGELEKEGSRRWICGFDPRGEQASAYGFGDDPSRLLIWSLRPGAPRTPRVLSWRSPDGNFLPAWDPTGTRIAAASTAEKAAWVWDLTGPPNAAPLALRRPDASLSKWAFFPPRDPWLVVTQGDSLAFWAFTQPRALVLAGRRGQGRGPLARPGHRILGLDLAAARGRQRGDGDQRRRSAAGGGRDRGRPQAGRRAWGRSRGSRVRSSAAFACARPRGDRGRVGRDRAHGRDGRWGGRAAGRALGGGRAAPALLSRRRRARGCGVAGPEVDSLREWEGDPALADAGRDEAAASHAAPRPADGEAAGAHEPAGGRRRGLGDGLQARDRRLPRLEGRADVVKGAPVAAALEDACGDLPAGRRVLAEAEGVEGLVDEGRLGQGRVELDDPQQLPGADEDGAAADGGGGEDPLLGAAGVGPPVVEDDEPEVVLGCLPRLLEPGAQRASLGVPEVVEDLLADRIAQALAGAVEDAMERAGRDRLGDVDGIPGKGRSRAQIHDRLWPGTFVSEASLRQVVMELRRALGDDPVQPALVRTVRRFGYAFSGEAREEVGSPAPGSPRPARCSLLRGVRELPLYEGENLLGREPEAVVRLVSEKASRRHARIVVDERGAVLEGLGSKNGTRVNGTRVREPVALEAGDRIEIGRELLAFCRGGAGTTRTDLG